ncbi:hypothetical protein JRO89_XS02G0231700 [Xanthoceras sorbifolium]|uniref:Uncharacterized protein n=1 Tax=Xanthoceras sorbifolium TaxID=99658 RepID=A0ABQ8IGT6_9ROSI|nr:hypothetical protein JRO89_XS02G0231700 [Xanthoceras sorbifolium]
MDKQKRFKRLSITRILKRKQKPAALKKSASLQQVWGQFMGCLTIKEENAKQTKNKDHSVRMSSLSDFIIIYFKTTTAVATMPEEDWHTPVKSSSQNASSIENPGTNANFPVPVSEYVPDFSSPYLGLHSRRESRLGFGGWRYSEDEQLDSFYSGLGGADLPSVDKDEDEDALVLDDGQPDDHSQIGISVHQQNDTQLTENKNRFTEIEDETENCFVEIEEDTSEGDDQERQTRNTALNIKSTSTRQVNVTNSMPDFLGLKTPAT